MPASSSDVARAIDATFRIESPKIIARLARMVRDVGLAEELAQDALLAALEAWPSSGVPENPGAWLLATAKNRALNALARQKRFAEKQAQIGHDLEAEEQRRPDEALADAIDDAVMKTVGDELLRLVFTACHPVLAREARVALTLRLLGGLTTSEIARAFVAPEPTVAQRIVRAKKTLAEANLPFEAVRKEEIRERLPSVLEVVYLIYNEGYAASAGDDWMRPALCEDALRLGRVLAGLVPGESEAHGLVALMELHASRTPARTGKDGEPVRLLEQDRARWDRLLVRRGLEGLARSEALALAAGEPRGPYLLQAAISACHARAHEAAATDWSTIASLYGELASRTRSPIVELNRAVAVGMASGPAAGLAVLEPLGEEPTLAAYHLLPAARGDLLEKLGRHAEAGAAFELAASLCKNERERTLLATRAAACIGGRAAES